MIWKKRVRYDRIKDCLDKAGIDETAERKFDEADLSAELLNLCEKGNGHIIAQFFCDEEYCRLFCDPETDSQKERIREICLETGIAYQVEKDVEIDLPEEDRIPIKWTIDIKSEYWKRLVCFLVRDVFGAEDFDIYRTW